MCVFRKTNVIKLKVAELTKIFFIHCRDGFVFQKCKNVDEIKTAENTIILISVFIN